MVNADLFRKIADMIEKEPESYDQTNIGYCGTKYCIAGLAVLLNGDELKFFRGAVLDRAASLLGIPKPGWDDDLHLFCEDWKPKDGLTVPQALRLIAEGATVAEVSA